MVSNVNGSLSCTFRLASHQPNVDLSSISSSLASGKSKPKSRFSVALLDSVSLSEEHYLICVFAAVDAV